jgi:hypothetical protein
MSQQIKPNQVMNQPEKKQNPFSARPRDLQYQATLDTPLGQALIGDKSEIDIGALIGGEPNSSSVSDNDTILTPPPVPAILSIKSQTVVYGADGKATIDVVVEVQDVSGSSEYDVRVAKQDGGL